MANGGRLLFIGGNWVAGEGPSLQWKSPVDGEATWTGNAASARQISGAIEAARIAEPAWAKRPLAERIKVIEAFAAEIERRRGDLVAAISRETGKPNWESATEVDAMVRKVPLSIAAFGQRRSPSESESNGEIAATRFKSHGVVAVFGPFNFPGHLPNGHIVPALLAGNTVVFKPSEQAPLVAELTVMAWESARLPAGAINLLQGGREVGQTLAAHPQLDGLFFTGSLAAGRALNQSLAAHPGRILALEMGGNNPLIVWRAGDLGAAAYQTIVSAFITAGQRCSCARRLIIEDGPGGQAFLEQLVAAAAKVRFGLPQDRPEPFMGTVISGAASGHILAAQEDLLARGGRSLLRAARQSASPALLSPGIVDVTEITDRPDAEIFGPLLQVIRVADWGAAIREANNTSFGLCAGLLSDDRKLYEEFYDSVRAGLINWNRPTTGASSALPFGGIGDSGNHRPSGSWAADYCSYPIASLEAPALTKPAKPLPGLADAIL
jgi:succinylglutamic semialdehyde dehydrogenase